MINKLNDYYSYIVSQSHKTVFLFNKITSKSFILKFDSMQQILSRLNENDTDEKCSDAIKNIIRIIKTTTEDDIKKYCTNKKIKNKAKLLTGVVFFVTGECNMKCPNCILYKNLKIATHKSMKDFPFPLACGVVDQLVNENKSSTQAILIAFSGAEPTLKVDFILSVIKYCEKSYPLQNFQYSINSNLLELNDAILYLFKYHKITIGTSLDGLEIANNINRLARDHNQVFFEVDKNIRLINGSKFKSRVNQIVIMISNNNYNLVNEMIIEYIVEEYKVNKIYITTDITSPITAPILKIVEKIYKMVLIGERLGIHVYAEPFNAYENLVSYNADAACGAYSGAGFTLLPNKTVCFCSYIPENIPFKSIKDLKDNRTFNDIISIHSVGQIKRCIGCSLEGSCIGGCAVAFNTTNSRMIKYRCNLYHTGTTFMIQKYLEKMERLYAV